MRNETWVNDLQNYFEEVKDTKFEWGIHDCCLFAADVFKLFHGYDPAQHVRGQYTTRKEALEVFKKIMPNSGHDLSTLVAGLMEEHRMLKKQPNFLQRGDLICYLEPTTGYENIGIVSINPAQLATPGATGLEFLEIEKASIINCWGL